MATRVHPNIIKFETGHTEHTNEPMLRIEAPVTQKVRNVSGKEEVTGFFIEIVEIANLVLEVQLRQRIVPGYPSRHNYDYLGSLKIDFIGQSSQEVSEREGVWDSFQDLFPKIRSVKPHRYYPFSVGFLTEADGSHVTAIAVANLDFSIIGSEKGYAFPGVITAYNRTFALQGSQQFGKFVELQARTLLRPAQEAGQRVASNNPV
jgi:hypothetical protein